MATRTINVLSLCAGYGGLDIGLELALGNTRTVCWVEWEAYPATLLATRMAEQALVDAPIWSDLRTFDGKPWRGIVDCIIGGYPCQPFSVAGKQRGTNDPRHLWPHIARIIDEVRPAFCFFENVRNHINIGLREVLADLRSHGYRVENDQKQPLYGLFSAAEVGAKHRRQRLFILAHTPSARIGSTSDTNCGSLWAETAAFGSTTVRSDNTTQDSTRLTASGGFDRSALANTPLFAPGPLEYATWSSTLISHPELAPAMGDTYGNGRIGPGLHLSEWGQIKALPDISGSSASTDGGETTIESPIRGMADGATPTMVGRAEQLRAGGNGVVPLQAAFAFHTLSQRISP